MQSAKKIGQAGPTADRSSGAQNESPQEALQMTELQEALRAVEAERGHTQATTSAAEAVEAQDPAVCTVPDLKGSSQAGGSKDERGPPAGEGIDRDEDVQDDSDDELEKMLVERHKRRTEAASAASAKMTDLHTRSGGSLPSATSSASSISDEDAARSSFAKIKWRNMPPLPPARDTSKVSPTFQPELPTSLERSMQALASSSTEPAAATGHGTSFRPSPSSSATSSAKISPAFKPGRATSSSESSAVQALTSAEPAAATSPRD